MLHEAAARQRGARCRCNGVAAGSGRGRRRWRRSPPRQRRGANIAAPHGELGGADERAGARLVGLPRWVRAQARRARPRRPRRRPRARSRRDRPKRRSRTSPRIHAALVVGLEAKRQLLVVLDLQARMRRARAGRRRPSRLEAFGSLPSADADAGERCERERATGRELTILCWTTSRSKRRPSPSAVSPLA